VVLSLFSQAGIKSISAGQQGIADYGTTAGNAYWFNEATGTSSFLGSGVAAITTGTDELGNYMIDMLYTAATSMSTAWAAAGPGWTAASRR
jgi:hypothetical protein